MARMQRIARIDLSLLNHLRIIALIFIFSGQMTDECFDHRQFFLEDHRFLGTAFLGLGSLRGRLSFVQK